MVAVLRTSIEIKGRNVDISGSLANTLSQYAEFLASQGSLASALTYLSNSQDVSEIQKVTLYCVSKISKLT